MFIIFTYTIYHEFKMHSAYPLNTNWGVGGLGDFSFGFIGTGDREFPK